MEEEKDIYGPSLAAAPTMLGHCRTMLELVEGPTEGQLPIPLINTARIIYSLRFAEEAASVELLSPAGMADAWDQIDPVDSDAQHDLIDEQTAYWGCRHMELFAHGPVVWDTLVHDYWGRSFKGAMRELGYSKWEDGLMSAMAARLYVLRAIEAECGLLPRRFSEGWS